MTKTADLLDTKIAELLKDPSNQPSSVFADILVEIADAISHAEKTASEARIRAFDPAVIDGTARGKMEDAIYVATRLKNATAALTAHHQTAINREEREAWNKSAAPVRQRVTDTAKELAATYEDCVKKLLDLFKRVDAADKEVARLNFTAPRGVEQLCTVEARIGGGAKIIEKVHLPWSNGGTIIDLWPPKSNWAAEYFESIHAGIVNAKPPPDDLERAEEARRQIAQGEADERERQRLNAEAAQAERRRLAGGELPR